MTNPLTNQPIPDEQLKSIADLANKQLQLEHARDALTLQLEAISDKLRKVQEDLLPSAMLEIGLMSFKLSDGTSIVVDKFYAARIPENRAQEAFRWLRDTGNDAIIKREIKCTFGKGEDARATLAFQALVECGVSPVDKQGVHPMTLKSFVRERIECGQELPTDLFGVFVGNRAKLTPAKE